MSTKSEHAAHEHGGSLNKTAFSATLHCLSGCSIGEVLGKLIGTALGWSNDAIIILAIALAFVFGYSLTLLSQQPNGFSSRFENGACTIRKSFLAQSTTALTTTLTDRGDAQPFSLNANILLKSLIASEYGEIPGTGH